MKHIKKLDSGAAVEDIQTRLVKVGALQEKDISGVFDEKTLEALHSFQKANSLTVSDEVDEKTWAVLVDASYDFGDRTLYLRMPYFHGHDVLELQNTLGVLGFSCGDSDGIFGAYTEDSVRKFQLNMGLPSDGIVGAYTFAMIRNLHHSWEGKKAIKTHMNLGYARAADVLEQNAICLFGTNDFTRGVASRMSNLALATNPASKIVSADSLLVTPKHNMMLVHIVLPGEQIAEHDLSIVPFNPNDSLAERIAQTFALVKESDVPRFAIELPGKMWEDAGEERSMQHFAITLLDGFCSALS